MNEKNKINMKIFYLILIGLVLFFSIFIFTNEYTLQTGEEVFLKIIPVDPRDILRGDYIILRYEIQENEKIKKFIVDKNLSNGDEIYLILEKDKNKNGYLKTISLIKPKNKLFIKAEIKNKNDIYFGIDKYFVPEKKGRINQENLKVLVSVDKYGYVKIKNLYRNNTIVDFKN